MLGVEPPVRGLALRIAQRAVLLLPALERRQAQPAGDEPVHVLEQQHFGEQVLVLGVRLQLAHGLVADAQQFLTGYGVLVLLDALEQKLLILLLGRGERAPQRGQHGSTCTVTSSSCRSRLSRSSTSSAMACAAATFASLSTAMVTSAYRAAAPSRERMPYAPLTPSTASAARWMSPAKIARWSTSTGTALLRIW